MIRFWWNKQNAGDDIRFTVARFRSGGPWQTRRIVHTIEKRTGLSFTWRGNWRFFGLLVLSDKRSVTESEVGLSALRGDEG